MKIYGKKSSPSPRLSDLKGKYLFATKGHGAVYKAGPPPLTPRQAMRRGILKPLVGQNPLEPYEPTKFRRPTTTAPQGGFQPPNQPVTYPEVEDEVKEEEVKEEGGPPGLDTQPGQFSPSSINWRSLANAARRGIGAAVGAVASVGDLSIRKIDNAVFGWADNVHPLLGALVRSGSYRMSRDIFLTAAFGDYAEPLIQAARNSDRFSVEMTEAIADTALLPGTRVLRRGAGSVLDGTTIGNVLALAATAGGYAYAAGEGAITAGATQMQDVVVGAIAANAANVASTATEWIPTATSGIAALEAMPNPGGGVMRNLFINLLQIAAGIPNAQRAIVNTVRRIEVAAPGAALLYGLRNVPGRQPGFYAGMQ